MCICLSCPDPTERYECGAVPDINQQNDVLKKGLENSTILAAINAFANLDTISIKFPKHGKRNVAEKDVARSLSTMLSCILRRPPSNLRSLSLCELELRDLTFLKKERDATLDYDLGALFEFKLIFSSDQLSAYFQHTPYIPVAFKTQASMQLPAILRCSPNLHRLEIVFDAREKSLREANWTSCCFANLQALKICNFDISEQSLLTLIKPALAKLAELSIDKIYLVEGTWASIYQILEAQSHDLNDVFELRGREYAEFGRFYEENEEDQRSFRRLFDKIDAKRYRDGQPSMLAPIHTEAMTFTHDFGLMGIQYHSLE
jgi:hypothetical protein